jgi:hypothetical protein
MQRVWYVAYGSNLCLERFRCYLAGGTPAGGMRRYDGSRDPRDPLEAVGLQVPGGLVFAGRSTVWGGGMAFYDPLAPGSVACRGYLVTGGQFADVVAQEMRRPAGGVFARTLEGLLPVAGSVHTIGAGRYETLARLGTRDDAPMFTVTCADVGALDPASPSAPYLRCIAAGLQEAHDWDDRRIAGYLAAFPGIEGEWSDDDLLSVAGELTP